MGIQWLATDFPVRNDHSDQFLDLPGGVPSLCVSQTPGCIATDIESGISPVIGAPSDDYFCCERDVFILFVLLFCILMIFIHWILYGCVQLPRWGAMRCFCWLLYIEDDIDEQIQMLSVRLLGLLFGIQVGEVHHLVCAHRSLGDILNSSLLHSCRHRRIYLEE